MTTLIRNGVRALALVGVGVLCGLLASPARSAVITYNFDVNGATTGFGVTTGQTYDWDSTTNGGFWSNNSVSTTGATTTNGWVQGNFPKFQPAGTPNYIVTVGNDEQVTGTFFSTAQTVVLNPVGAGTLEAINTNAPNPPTIATADGFLGSGSADVTFNVPISGAGIVQPSNGGNLRFNAVNTYTGGTNLSSTATLVHFNNGSSFGTGFINMGVSGTAPLLASGGATITLANNFTSTVNNAGINFAPDASTPVICTGTVTLGANNAVLKNNGLSSSPLTFSNVISGSGTVTFSGANGGTTTLGALNLYTGSTILGVSGSTAIRLKLGVSGSIADSTSIVLAGGTLDPDGFDQPMSLTTLGMTVGSTIDYGAGASEVDFANSSASAWTGTLNLTNFDSSVDKLRFGTDSTGLTAAQLNAITFNGLGAGSASLDANGYVTSAFAPEPGAAMVLLLGAPLFSAIRRRRSV